VIGVIPAISSSAQPWECEPERALAFRSAAARGIYGGQRGVVELSHGGRLSPASLKAEQAKSDAERVVRNDARLSGLHASLRIHAVATPLQEDTVGQARPWCAPALGSDRCSADRLCEPGGLLWCVYPQTERDRVRLALGAAPGHITPTRHP